jgi:primosomal protein N' (replication factor Y)
MPAQLDLNRKTRRKVRSNDISPEQPKLSDLTDPQQKAFDEINSAFVKTDVVLLHGVTSSGKTEIYIHLIREALEKKQQVLYLLPEIALTTQIINRLRNAFGDRVAVYHSKYSNAERIKTWRKLLGASFDSAQDDRRKDSAQDDGIGIVLGVRSAIFLPFKKPGLIIIDEEHENTYKQFDPAPRYHARDTAIMLARHFGAKVLLGTATPSIETYYNCLTGKFSLVEVNERYLNLQLPEISVENIKDLRRRRKMQSDFSPALLDGIAEALKNGEQAILFQNRRGFSVFLECGNCAEVPKCRNCDVSLTYHKKQNRLYCHYCGYSMAIPSQCPSCGSPELKMKGFGTEKIEEEIALFFPAARVERLDLDAAGSRKSYEQLIARFEQRQSDILVGTQMVSKGLDFDNVKLVGIMNADTMLNYPDFRAHERSYQLMSQVSGRAGRKNSRGKVIIQTSYHDHPVITSVVNNDYKRMYDEQAEERRKFSYPPFSRLIEITLKHRKIEVVDQASSFLASILKKTVTEKIMGPEYPLVSRIRNLHLKSMIIKIEKSASLVITKQLIVSAILQMKAREDLRGIQHTIDVDPY